MADIRDHVSGARFAIGGRRAGTWDVERDVRRGADEGLRATVIAEYGRYLLGASSRAGNPAANLQGIWNADLRPPWSSNYTININTQMNYWPAPLVGLDDSAEPLTGLVRRLAHTGTGRGGPPLRRARLGGAPQQRPLGLEPAGRHGPRRAELGDLDDGRRLAHPQPVGPLRVHAATGPCSKRPSGR